MFYPDLQIGDIVSNDRLVSIFGCSTQGGIRPSNRANSIVVVSNHVKSLYDDRWEDNILHYTGSGIIGNQTLTRLNKSILEADGKGRRIFLFEVFVEQKYTFRGEVFLVEEPYQEEQLDDLSNQRLVWVFPLALSDNGKNVQIDKLTIENTELKTSKKVKRMDDNSLFNRAKNSTGKVGKRDVKTTYYNRDPYVSEYAKRKANGICQLCEEPAPFKGTKGEPYLEAHHIVWLSRGGSDTIKNTIALCPNCHTKMHIVDDDIDIMKLKRINLT